MAIEPQATSKDLVIHQRLTIPARDLFWSASRSSGPGGQNVNKVASKVTLRFDLRGTDALNRTQKTRLRKLAGKRIDSLGVLAITAQAERSQRQNLEQARHRLRELIARALVPPKRRVATKPTHSSQRRRLQDKRRRSDQKKVRGKVIQVDG
ncbi:MAG: alternative ribosome rescue aminoacyl-tRNA hydrolase ArfB [Polyangiales bacterium]